MRTLLLACLAALVISSNPAVAASPLDRFLPSGCGNNTDFIAATAPARIIADDQARLAAAMADTKGKDHAQLTKAIAGCTLTGKVVGYSKGQALSLNYTFDDSLTVEVNARGQRAIVLCRVLAPDQPRRSKTGGVATIITDRLMPEVAGGQLVFQASRCALDFIDLAGIEPAMDLTASKACRFTQQPWAVGRCKAEVAVLETSKVKVGDANLVRYALKTADGKAIITCLVPKATAWEVEGKAGATTTVWLSDLIYDGASNDGPGVRYSTQDCQVG